MDIITTQQSPNYNRRPVSTVVDAVVVHTTEGTHPGDMNWLCNPISAVSAHYVISPAGLIYELVHPSLRAWHAGESKYAGRSDWNDFSIGIEISHREMSGPILPAQMSAVTDLVTDLARQYPIKREMIVAHRWIAPGRRRDPTSWSDEKFRSWISSLDIGATMDVVARVTASSGARCRTDPRTTAPVIDTLPQGTYVTYLSTVRGQALANSNEWCQVRLMDGRVGYVFAGLLQIGG